MTRSRRSHPLTRDELLDLALSIVDNEGLEALSMRRLGEAAGVEAMSLYHHIPSKQALLDLTVDRMRDEMRLPEPLPRNWMDRMEAILVEYRRILLAHPNMISLATHRTGSVATSGLQYFMDVGLPAETAVEMYQSLIAFVVGFATLGSGGPDGGPGGARTSLQPAVAERLAAWTDDTFRKTLRILMAGYAEQIPAAS
jgi:TetR/AcrR family transcriptional regulator, tetracycline repressor protein